MNAKNCKLTKGYTRFFNEVKTKIRTAQYQAFRAVNKKLVMLYWDIGEMIVKRQKQKRWGKSVIENLSKDIRMEFPGIQGFSGKNLWYMRQFYLEYYQKPNLQQLVGEIAWSHNLIIMGRCKDLLEREFYLRMTRRMGWSKSILTHQIENRTYEKILRGQTNFDKALPKTIREQAKTTVKDEYLFDFLELGEAHSEHELEQAMIAKVNRFLMEMGGAFAFMGNQFRLEVEGNEYFIDILLYHRRLKCLIALELKVGKFIPEYVGKMQFYLTVLDEIVRNKGENPSIGIILCKQKNQTIVEYALKQSRKPIGVAQYKIMKKLPKRLKDELPGPIQIQKLLKSV